MESIIRRSVFVSSKICGASLISWILVHRNRMLVCAAVTIAKPEANVLNGSGILIVWKLETFELETGSWEVWTGR